MYCSKCGLEFGSGEYSVCPHCGKRVVAGLENTGFERTILRLSRFWYLFAGLNIALGLAGLFMVQTGQVSAAGPWEPWPHPPVWIWTLTGAAGWTLVMGRVLLSLAAGWGLRNGADWARVVAIAAGAFAMLQFPFGLVLGAYTIAVLLLRHSGTEPFNRPGHHRA